MGGYKVRLSQKPLTQERKASAPSEYKGAACIVSVFIDFITCNKGFINIYIVKLPFERLPRSNKQEDGSLIIFQ